MKGSFQMLEELKPGELFHSFEQQTLISGVSGNEKQASDHLVEFAMQKMLEDFQDKALNGIVVAYGLALLDSADIPRPPLEMLITTSEEMAVDHFIMVSVGVRLHTLDGPPQPRDGAGCATKAEAATIEERFHGRTSE